MSLKLYNLLVDKVQKESSDTISIHLKVPQSMRGTFRYKSGQYLTFDIVINGKKERRSYSLCSSLLTDRMLSVAVKRVENGLVSNHLNDHLEAGQRIETLSPLGSFYLTPNTENEKSYLLIGAGSGITPLISIAKTVLKAEPNSNVYLVYGSRHEDDIIFGEELATMQAENEGRFVVKHCISQPKGALDNMFNGRANGKTLEEALADTNFNWKTPEAYLCGPGELIQLSETFLAKKGWSEDQINKEYFVVEEKDLTEEDKVSIGSDENMLGIGEKAVVEVYCTGKMNELEMGADANILDEVVEADMDPPYACMTGSCGTCRAKVLEGGVEMDDREMLTDKEIEQGYILTCQSHPRTKRLVINYDL